MDSLFSFIFYVAQAVHSFISRIIIFFSLKVQKFDKGGYVAMSCS